MLIGQLLRLLNPDISFYSIVRALLVGLSPPSGVSLRLTGRTPKAVTSMQHKHQVTPLPSPPTKCHLRPPESACVSIPLLGHWPLITACEHQDVINLIMFRLIESEETINNDNIAEV